MTNFQRRMGISLEQMHGQRSCSPGYTCCRSIIGIVTSAQKDAMAQKQARAGNLSRANQTVCSVLKPAVGHDTLHKLQEKTPVGSVVFVKQFWPTTEALDETRRHDEWLHIQEHSFAIKKIGQYFRTCKPLSAQDADGGRGREHVGGLFSDVCARKGKQLITTSDLMSVWSSRRILQLRP